MKSEVQSKMAWDCLRYAQVWEDHQVLQDALDINHSDDILMIASAGCNVLNLALQSPRKIIAIDLNPAQLALLELKIATISHLSHSDLLHVLGVSCESGRQSLAAYDRARHFLKPDTRSFWDHHWKTIEEGIFHSGRLEKYFRHLAKKIAPHVSALQISQIFSAKDIAGQREAARSITENSAVKNIVEEHFGFERLAGEGRDPAQLAYVKENNIGNLCWRRLCHHIENVLASDNYYLAYFLLGDWPEFSPLPPYLQASNFHRLKDCINSIQMVHASLEEWLEETPKNSVSKAVLSDVFEYMSETNSHRLFDQLAQKMRKGGRLAYWNLMVSRTAPHHMKHRLVSMSALSKTLSERDRCFFYSGFFVDEVIA